MGAGTGTLFAPPKICYPFFQGVVGGLHRLRDNHFICTIKIWSL